MSTPEQKRDAWLALLGQVERQLLATRENAQALVRSGREDYDSTAWGANRLLQDFRALKVPVVPVDDARGQGDILEALSTPGENPGDESQEDMLRRLRPACICPPDICLGAESQDGPGTVECYACLTMDPELPCLADPQ